MLAGAVRSDGESWAGVNAKQLEFCSWGCEQELPPLPEQQPMGGCSCFALGKKQVKREKTKICNFTVHRWDSRHSPVLWHAQPVCREAGAG